MIDRIVSTQDHYSAIADPAVTGTVRMTYGDVNCSTVNFNLVITHGHSDFITNKSDNYDFYSGPILITDELSRVGLCEPTKRRNQRLFQPCIEIDDRLIKRSAEFYRLFCNESHVKSGGVRTDSFQKTGISPSYVLGTPDFTADPRLLSLDKQACWNGTPIF